MGNKLLYQCVVLDNQDPLMLGRVRARAITDDYTAIIGAIKNPVWDPIKDPWTQRDPFVFLPLLPYYIYQVPKNQEMVLAIYGDSDSKFLNQFYIQNQFSSPTATNFEFNVGSDSNMGTGFRYKNSTPLLTRVSGSTYNSNGIFPRSGDNAMLGRGSADIIVKEDTTMLRAGKFTEEKLIPNQIPTPNTNRSFIQLSRFPRQTSQGEVKKYSTISPTNVQLKYLVEYNIINPENDSKPPVFTGAIYLYQLKPDIATTSDNLSVGVNLDERLKKLVYFENFMGLPSNLLIDKINKFLESCNSSNVIDGNVLFSPQTEKFPILYRPSEDFYSQMNGLNSSDIVKQNLVTIYDGVKLKPWLTQSGWNYILTQDKTGYPTEIVESEVVSRQSQDIPITYTMLGGERVILMSQKTQGIPGKNRINFEDSIYGFEESKIVDEILPNTSSTVRGEELLELINLISRFLLTHTHAFPGLPPVTETEDGTTASAILSELQNATVKILNENIRIN